MKMNQNMGKSTHSNTFSSDPPGARCSLKLWPNDSSKLGKITMGLKLPYHYRLKNCGSKIWECHNLVLLNQTSEVVVLIGGRCANEKSLAAYQT